MVCVERQPPPPVLPTPRSVGEIEDGQQALHCLVHVVIFVIFLSSDDLISPFKSEFVLVLAAEMFATNLITQTGIRSAFRKFSTRIKHHDIVVVGNGIVGSAAVCQLGLCSPVPGRSTIL